MSQITNCEITLLWQIETLQIIIISQEDTGVVGGGGVIFHLDGLLTQYNI